MCRICWYLLVGLQMAGNWIDLVIGLSVSGYWRKVCRGEYYSYIFSCSNPCWQSYIGCSSKRHWKTFWNKYWQTSYLLPKYPCWSIICKYFFFPKLSDCWFINQAINFFLLTKLKLAIPTSKLFTETHSIESTYLSIFTYMLVKSIYVY